METNQYTQVNLQQRKQWTLLSKSLLVAGIGFLAIFAFGWGLYAILMNSYNKGTLYDSNILDGMMFASIILLFVVIFMSMWCWARIGTVHTSTILAMISFYSIAEGLCLGVFLFSLQLSSLEGSNYHLSDIFWIFGLTGGMFMLCGLIGQMLSVRFTMSLGRFLMIASFAFIIFLLITSLIGVFGGQFSQNFSIGINAVFGLLMILYIMFDFSVIKKSEVFMSALDSNMQLKFTLMFGFKLLIDLMGLFWTIARFYLIARR